MKRAWAELRAGQGGAKTRTQEPTRLVGVDACGPKLRAQQRRHDAQLRRRSALQVARSQRLVPRRLAALQARRLPRGTQHHRHHGICHHVGVGAARPLQHRAAAARVAAAAAAAGLVGQRDGAADAQHLRAAGRGRAAAVHAAQVARTLAALKHHLQGQAHLAQGWCRGGARPGGERRDRGERGWSR